MPVAIRRHPRARRFVLRVSGGVIQLTIPTRARQGDALNWAQEQHKFIEQELTSEPDAVPLAMDAVLPVLGQTVRVVPGLLTTGDFSGETLAIAPGPSGAVADRLERCLRRLVLAASEADLRECWASLGVPEAEVTVRAYQRRWGACAHDGRTAINWRLVFAPREVLRYVCAHEAAHRIEMNHSSRFWSVVERLMPDYRQHEAWLRDHGKQLSAYGPPEAD
ncbi:MAG: YgjP-like metallopeptidase domain-containing protein [Pseudomonadota bacterium]